MSNVFLQTLRDETLRIELGTAAVSGLAVENLELSTSRLSREVRASVIERRLDRPVVTAPTPEVALPTALPALEPCAA